MFWSFNGKQLKQLTRGKFEVINVLGFNTSAKSIIYQSNQNNPIQYSNFSVNVANGKVQLLDNGQGTHYAQLSANGKYLSDRWSSPTTFRQYDLVATTKPAVTKLHADGNPWKDYNVPQITSGTIKAADGQTDLYYRFKAVLAAAHRKTGRRAVVLIDEYDKPLLDVLDCDFYATVNENRIRLEDMHREILKGFYSVFKGTDEHLRFVLLTGNIVKCFV